MIPNSNAPLAGLRVVEVSSFVASPLCGLTLSQLGADVIRVDPTGGGADYNRWPVTRDGASIYWTGLNRGKRSVICDLRSPQGQKLVQQMITAPGTGGGILVTNTGGREWLSHETLSALRPDVITVEVLGRRDGTPGVDYTVNAALGFPSITGPVDHDGPVNHVLPAWDVACGLYAALAVTAAVRRRENTGEGARITLPLDDVALATAGTLGYLTEVRVNQAEREATGNAVYGTYGSDFVTSDGARFMIVALTPRHFRGLVSATGTGDAVHALEEGVQSRLHARSPPVPLPRGPHQPVCGLVRRTHRRRGGGGACPVRCAARAVPHLHRSGRFTRRSQQPLFAPLEQPRIGTYLAAGSPIAFDGTTSTWARPRTR